MHMYFVMILMINIINFGIMGHYRGQSYLKELTIELNNNL